MCKVVWSEGQFFISLVLMPYLDTKDFYSAFGAEILKLARPINDASIFQKNSKTLINRMMKQRGKRNRLSTTLNKLFGCHFDVFFISTITLLLKLLNVF